MSKTTCSIDGCDKPSRSRGWCHAHYERWRQTQPTSRTCSIDGCDLRPFGRGWCKKHHTRWLRHGDPFYVEKARDPIEALMMYVDASGDCWEWTAHVQENGYGRWQNEWAHRKVWEFLVGPIPKGLDVDHLCMNKRCVNPDHLEPVTRAENMRRVSPEKLVNHRFRT